jgi:hypothetical protein
MGLSDSTIRVCLTLKVAFGLPLRQATGLVASLLKLANLGKPVPPYARQKTLIVSLDGRSSTGGLDLLVDSTGIIQKTRDQSRPFRLGETVVV